MLAGISSVTDTHGNIVSARLMGSPDECLAIDWPYHRWCTLPHQHDGDHEYNFEKTGRLIFQEE
jgi:hypothetical protein